MNAYQKLIRKMIRTDVPDHWVIRHQDNGFLVHKMHGHPLASKKGCVMLHRLIAFEYLGAPQSSPCSVCGYLTQWAPGSDLGSIKVIPKGSKHSCNPEDFDLVCGWCQANRTKLQDRFHDIAKPYFGMPQNDRPNIAKIHAEHA